MGLTTAFKTDVLEHLLQNATIPGVGDGTGLRGSTVAGSFYISLHTADPGAAGSQTTSEATYGDYARVAVVRSASGWTVVDEEGDNAALITFPTAASGTNTITHFGLGTDSSGAGTLVGSGSLDSPLSVVTGVAPFFAIGDLNIAFTA